MYTEGSHGVSRWNIITHISSKLNSYINYISWNKMCVREIIEIRHETVNSKSFHFYVHTKNVLRNKTFWSFNKNFIYPKFVRNFIFWWFRFASCYNILINQALKFIICCYIKTIYILNFCVFVSINKIVAWLDMEYHHEF